MRELSAHIGHRHAKTVTSAMVRLEQVLSMRLAGVENFLVVALEVSLCLSISVSFIEYDQNMYARSGELLRPASFVCH